MTEPTPRPWRLEAGTPNVIRTHPNGGDFIAEFERAEDAQRAILAVNSIDDLVAALQDAERTIDALIVGEQINVVKQAAQTKLARIRTALTKAQEPQP